MRLSSQRLFRGDNFENCAEYFVCVGQQQMHKTVNTLSNYHSSQLSYHLRLHDVEKLIMYFIL